MVLEVSDVTKRILGRLKVGKDLVLAITGDERGGKSSLAISIGLSMDPLFNLERNILYSPSYEEMKGKVMGLPKYSPIIADEAIKNLYKLRRNRMQTYVNQLYAICGKENKLSILNMPRFLDFSEYFRRHRIKLWIWIIDEISAIKDVGYAVIFSKSWNQVSEDPWYFRELQKVIDEYGRQKKLKEVEFSLNHKMTVLSRSRNYVGMLKFGKTPESLWGRYNELKNKYAYEDIEEDDGETKKEIKWKKRLQKSVLLLHEKYKMRHADIADELEVSKARVSQILSEKYD